MPASTVVMPSISINQKLYDRIVHNLSALEGWCTASKACRLADAILVTKARVVVEVGIFGGRSLIPMAMACDFQGQGVVWGIDPWRKDDCCEGENVKENDAWWRSLNLERIYRGFVQRVLEHDLTGRCNWLRGTAEFFAPLFPRKSIDVLHIDGNHSEKKSVEDVKLWLPKVRKGGYIFFDDIAWPTTAKAVKLLKTQCKLVEEIYEYDAVEKQKLVASYAYFIKK